MLAQFDSQNSIEREGTRQPVKSFLGIMPLNGELALFAILLSAILTTISLLLSLNRNMGSHLLTLHPGSQVVSDDLYSESVPSSSYANVPVRTFGQPQCWPDLSGSVKRAERYEVAEGEVLTYTILLTNTGSSGTVYVSDPIPVSTGHAAGSARVTPFGGIVTDTANHLEWTGTVLTNSAITIAIPVTIVPGTLDGETIVNAAWISYGDSQISRTASVTVDTDGPNLWGCTPSEWVTSTQTPTCTIQARDFASGVDVSRVTYRYSTDGGISWNTPWLLANCSGKSGSTLTQTCTAASVPFGQDSETTNRVEFKVSDMVGHTAYTTCIVPIDTVSPTFGSLDPQEVVTTTRTPTCTVTVSDVTSGLNVGSAYYRYSKDGGTHWSDYITATCTGSYGAKGSQWITATAVPFNQNSSALSLIQFRTSDVAGNFRSSIAYPVSISVPYTVYLPLIANNYTPPFYNGDFEIIAGDFAVNWQREVTLSVSIATTLSNGDLCYSGTHCALLGNPNYPCRSIPLGYGRMYQTFGLPLTGTPKLSFRYRVFSYDEYYEGYEDQSDLFDVYIDNIFDGSSPILILRTGSQDGNYDYGCRGGNLDITDWKEFPEKGSPEFDLSAIPDGHGGTVDYRGKTVQLSFYVYSREFDPRRTVAWYNTWVYVDDVRVKP